MGEVTLKVPGEYADDFRMAILEEIAFDTRMILGDKKERLERAGGEQLVRPELSADLPDHRRQLLADAGLLEQAGEPGGRDPVQLHGDLSAISHICETMARDVIRPRLDSALMTGPIEERDADVIHELTRRATWAADKASELLRSWAESRQQQKAA